MDEQWQAPPQYGWEQPPPPIPAPTPEWQPSWEPPVTLPPPRRRPRAVWVAAALGGALLLGAVLATCGPSAEGTGTPAAEPSPSPATSVVPATTGPSALATSPAGPVTPAGPASPEVSPEPVENPPPTPRQNGRPHHGTPAAAPPQPDPSAPGSLAICAEAERLGEWPPGSAEAKLCRELYGR